MDALRTALRTAERTLATQLRQRHLEGQAVPSVVASIDDVEARNREQSRVRVSSELRHMLEERLLLRTCGQHNSVHSREAPSILTSAGVGGRGGDREDGIGAEIGLVRRPIHLEHQVVDLALIGRVEASKCWSDLIVNRLDRLQHALAQVAVTAITELTGLS